MMRAVRKTIASLGRIVPLLRLNLAIFSLLPLYLGLVLASGRIWPSGIPGIGWRWLLGALACAPAGTGWSYLLNDAFDLEDDRLNPRRARSPLVQGRVSRREVLLWALVCLASALALSAFVSKAFFWGVAFMSALSAAYSVPPVRLKIRPGLDLLTQAFALGAVRPALGWLIVRPLAEMPWGVPLHFMLALSGPFLLVMLPDLPADRARGRRTAAVVLGSRGGVVVSVALVAASFAVLLAMVFFRQVIAPRFLAYWLALAAIPLPFLPGAWRLRNDPVPLRRHVYRRFVYPAGLGSYALWIAYLGGWLPA